MKRARTFPPSIEGPLVKVDAERVSVDRFDRGRAADRFAPEEALVAMIIGGVFEFHPKLRVGFLEAQNSWAPGLLSRSSGTTRSIVTRTRRVSPSRRASTSGATAGGRGRERA